MPILLLLQSNIHIQSVWYSSDDKVDVLIELPHITHNIGRVEVKGKDCGGIHITQHNINVNLLICIYSNSTQYYYTAALGTFSQNIYPCSLEPLLCCSRCMAAWPPSRTGVTVLHNIYF